MENTNQPGAMRTQSEIAATQALSDMVGGLGGVEVLGGLGGLGGQGGLSILVRNFVGIMYSPDPDPDPKHHSNPNCKTNSGSTNRPLRF